MEDVHVRQPRADEVDPGQAGHVVLVHGGLPIGEEIGVPDFREELGRRGVGVGQCAAVEFRRDPHARPGREPGDALEVGNDAGPPGGIRVGRARRPRPHADHRCTERDRGLEHAGEGQALILAVRRLVVAAVGRNRQARPGGQRLYLAGSDEVAVRHVDVAAPLDALQPGLAHEFDDRGGRKLTERDRDEAGLDHGGNLPYPPGIAKP